MEERGPSISGEYRNIYIRYIRVASSSACLPGLRLLLRHLLLESFKLGFVVLGKPAVGKQILERREMKASYLYHKKKVSQLFRNDSLICSWSSSSPRPSFLTFNSLLWPLSSSEQDHCLDGSFSPPPAEPLFTIANAKTEKAWQLNQKPYMGMELQTCWEIPMYTQLEVSRILTNTFDPEKNAQKCLNSAYPKNSPNLEIARIFVRKNTTFVWKNTSFVRVTLSVRVKYAFYTYKTRTLLFLLFRG